MLVGIHLTGTRRAITLNMKKQEYRPTDTSDTVYGTDASDYSCRNRRFLTSPIVEGEHQRDAGPARGGRQGNKGCETNPQDSETEVSKDDKISKKIAARRRMATDAAAPV